MDSVYQKIYNYLEPFFLDDWEQIVYYAEYGENSYSMEFFCKNAEDSWKKCFELQGMDRKGLLGVFKEIHNVIKAEREATSPDKLWTNMTMCIQDTGNFKVDYDFTDLTEYGYEYKKEWKKKYLE